MDTNMVNSKFWKYSLNKEKEFENEKFVNWEKVVANELLSDTEFLAERNLSNWEIKKR